MGCSPSCSSSRRRSKPAFKSIRVVHLNGFVEDFDEPTTVIQITGKPPKHFLCSSSQLLIFGSQPLALDARLQPGHLYFLLPLSVFQSNASPTDLVSLVTRLTAAANRGSSPVSSPSPSRLFSSNRSSPLGRNMSSPAAYNHRRDDETLDQSTSEAIYIERMASRVSSWKPILETIEEKSFRRPSMRVEST